MKNLFYSLFLLPMTVLIFTEIMVAYIPPYEIAKYTNQALVFVKKKEYEKAIRAYKNAIKVMPYICNGYEGIEKIYETIEKEKPLSLEEKKDREENLLSVLKLVGRPTDAEMDEHRYGRSWFRYMNYDYASIVHVKLKQYKKAIKTYKKMISIDPINCEPYIGIANIYDTIEKERRLSFYERYDRIKNIIIFFKNSKKNLDKYPISGAVTQEWLLSEVKKCKTIFSKKLKEEFYYCIKLFLFILFISAVMVFAFKKNVKKKKV